MAGAVNSVAACSDCRFTTFSFEAIRGDTEETLITLCADCHAQLHPKAPQNVR